MKDSHSTPPVLEKMLMDYYIKQGRKKFNSNFWIIFNNLHINELLSQGYDTFKYTIAPNYFTWLFPNPSEGLTLQLNFLTKNLSKKEVSHFKQLAEKMPLSRNATQEFNTTTFLLWQYAKNQGLEKELASLSEPQEGSPPAVSFEGRLISQDLANSLLEIDTIRKHAEGDSIRTILEIGAGYGRSAYVWLTLGGIQKYVIVDVPPALYLSQRYLSSQFPQKKVFKYRDFKSFSEVKDEYDGSDLVFLMPWQIEFLPQKSVDLIFSIDALNEMKFDMIKCYFKITDKLAKKYFYMKCCKEYKSEEGMINQGGYPIPVAWKCLVDRQCRVQTKYFESLYDIIG